MKIESVEMLRDAYGTYVKAAEILGMSKQHLDRCRARGSLPMAHYFVHRAVLEADGHTAPKELWGFKEKPQVTNGGGEVS